jgi:hypothetical protein
MRALILAALVAVFSFPAYAAVCNTTESVANLMRGKNMRSASIAHVFGAESVANLFMTPDGAEWALVIHLLPDEDGVRYSCIIAAGENWRWKSVRGPEA